MTDFINRINQLVPHYVASFNEPLSDLETIERFLKFSISNNYVWNPLLTEQYRHEHHVPEYDDSIAMEFINLVQVLGEFNSRTGQNLNWEKLVENK